MDGSDSNLPSLSIPHDIVDFLGSSVDFGALTVGPEACVWDGAASKRRSLQSMTVSLSALTTPSSSPTFAASEGKSSSLMDRFFSFKGGSHTQSQSCKERRGSVDKGGIGSLSLSNRSLSADSKPPVRLSSFQLSQMRSHSTSDLSRLDSIGSNSTSSTESNSYFTSDNSDSEDDGRDGKKFSKSPAFPSGSGSTSRALRESYCKAFSSSWSSKSASIQKTKRSAAKASPNQSQIQGDGSSMSAPLPFVRTISIASSSASEESVASSSSAESAGNRDNKSNCNQSSAHDDSCCCRPPVKLGDSSRPAELPQETSIGTDCLSLKTSKKKKVGKKQQQQIESDEAEAAGKSRSSSAESLSVTVTTLLKQIDSKNYARKRSDGQTLDDDQIEMLRRIEKCLLV